MAELSAVLVLRDRRSLEASREDGHDLDDALRAARMRVVHALPDEVVKHLTGPDPPDLLLLPSSLGADRVGRYGRYLRRGDGDHLSPAQEGEPSRPHRSRHTAVMVYLDGALADLEACVKYGYHYLVPPYRGSLIRTQLMCDVERQRLARVAQEAALAVSLSQYERELRIAREIQEGFLPSDLPRAPGWEIDVRFRPARAVAGDFYDAFPLLQGRRLSVVVADVCDKGVGAALFMALIRTLLRHTAEHAGRWSLFDPPQLTRGVRHESPALVPGAAPLLQAMTGTNRYMTSNHQGYFATVFFGVLDPESGCLLYANGGHNPPLLRRADGRLERLQVTGPAVGLHPDSEFRLAEVRLDPGDMLLAYTDGVTESRDPEGEFYGEDRLSALVRGLDGTSLGLLDRVEADVRAHLRGGEQYDDITMLALRRLAGP
ncbi:MAG: PP2C family protein-serine/threonine phosphatase [Microbispora sp.]|nr:PP2C family protein-serine/threonine phosphatase [Microbispora sp.]